MISGTALNQRSKVTVLPLASTAPTPVMVAIPPSDTKGLNANSDVICIEPMTFDKRRFVKRLRQLEPEQVRQIKQIISRYLDLEPIE
ncbi:MAG: type II toxin-antitoxin system PemK/MazF family toxin [Leptolyngbya sp. Prado105]|jgi:mRNA interferase MazF|nr:type II toxin-antitoxin system PemK/MazF family toxin [Leptolyngbya sp. Prado105]